MVFVTEDTECELIKQLQDKVADLQIGPDEETCRRFLVAREYNLYNAEEMMRKNAKWRKEVDIDYLTLEWQIPTDISQDFKFTHTGKSHNGGPVFWVPGGEWNLRRFVECGKAEDIMKFAYKTMEEVLIEIKKLGNRPFVAIYGFEGLTYYKVAHYESNRLIFAMFQAFEQNYPETLQDVVVVNAPYPFYMVWNIIKPLLSSRTTAKIHVFGSDKKKYTPLLRQLCPDDAIPKEYL